MKKDNLNELQAKLKALDGLSPLERLKQALLLTAGAIDKLKADVLESGFTDIENEISFFKVTKPNIYALQIYEVDLYNITVNEPPGAPEMRKAYYEQELLYIIRFFRTHAFHYQYYKTGAAVLDAQYFTRDGKPSDIPVLDLAEPFPGFTTPLDYLFAKFIAAERMQEYLLDQLNSTLRPAKVVKQGPLLRWTGEAINLVEVAYGIWLTGQLNDGNVTITDIIHWLEDKLSVSIGVPNARWAQIAARKNSSPAKFLDRMRDAILGRIDQEQASPARKRKAKRTS
jgi:hypothetical protein